MDNNNARALELIEQAQRDTPFCECGRVTVPVGRPGGVWLECASLGEARSTLARVLTLDFVASHTRRRIVNAADFELSPSRAA
jgi:hypothetical protein